MLNIKKSYYTIGAAFTVGTLAPGLAHAGNNFTSIASNINTSIAGLPGLLTGLSYMFGILLGVLCIMKIKDHVENPTQTPLKDGAIRLAAGGALFALPIMFEAMFETVGSGNNAQAAKLNKVSFNVAP
ncbi:MAG: hypothetical protein ACLFR0_05600 [Alphaproteobacteria bacterium]